MSQFSSPSRSRLLLGLGILCIGLLFINIILTVTFRSSRNMEKLQRLEESLNKVLMDTSKDDLQKDMKKVLAELKILSDQVPVLPTNGSQDSLCPLGWTHFAQSCYYRSTDHKDWVKSKRFCEDRNSHLVVINNEEEQDYLNQIARMSTTWIGLSDMEGEWKWVDGTPYNSTPTNWMFGEPTNYYIHELRISEDCAQIREGGEWNDDHCPRKWQYICEKKITS